MTLFVIFLPGMAGATGGLGAAVFLPGAFFAALIASLGCGAETLVPAFFANLPPASRLTLLSSNFFLRLTFAEATSAAYARIFGRALATTGSGAGSSMTHATLFGSVSGVSFSGGVVKVQPSRGRWRGRSRRRRRP